MSRRVAFCIAEPEVAARHVQQPVGVLYTAAILQLMGCHVTLWDARVEPSMSREIGEAAHATGSQAIRAPSATGVDETLAVFPELFGSGRLLAELAERWESIADL